jgi:hypothetical protein
VIRISTFENNSFEPFKTITEENFDCLKNDSDVLKSSYTQFVVFKYLQLNLTDYFTFINKTSNIPANKIDYGIVTNIHIVLQANRLILNVLMAFKFFLDNAETFLKRKYGKDSKIVNDYITMTRNYFDNSFAYRFLSKLRNYSVHLGFPLEVLHLDINFNKNDPEKSQCTLQLLLNVEILKQEKALFGQIVYKDLILFNENIDLAPLINELSHYIIQIQKYIYRVQKDDITESLENIEYFVGNYKTETNQIKIYYNYQSVSNEVSFQVYDLPYDIIKDYKKTYLNWN